MTPEEFLQLYERKASSRHFEDVSPLITDDAVFWFNDGSYVGKESVRKAFENTWALEIRNENYWLDHIRWLVKEERFAVCIFSYHWTGMVEGKFRELGSGRGTCILGRAGSNWKIIHEHLSREPVPPS